jgi:hypothetical protein
MSAMLVFYGKELPIEGINFDCRAQDADKKVASLLEELEPGYAFLVLSHDWGKGDCLITYFHQILNGEPRKFTLPSIQLFLFEKVNG